MRRMLLAIAVLWPSLVLAAVLNVEFKFTPYTGDLKEDHVDSVPGTARVIRIKFEPSDPKAPYKAQLRWASVTDQVKEDDSGAGSYRGTNQAGEGVESKDATGKVVYPPRLVVVRSPGGTWEVVS